EIRQKRPDSIFNYVGERRESLHGATTHEQTQAMRTKLAGLRIKSEITTETHSSSPTPCRHAVPMPALRAFWTARQRCLEHEARHPGPNYRRTRTNSSAVVTFRSLARPRPPVTGGSKSTDRAVSIHWPSRLRKAAISLAPLSAARQARHPDDSEIRRPKPRREAAVRRRSARGRRRDGGAAQNCRAVRSSYRRSKRAPKPLENDEAFSGSPLLAVRSSSSSKNQQQKSQTGDGECREAKIPPPPPPPPPPPSCCAASAPPPPPPPPRLRPHRPLRPLRRRLQLQSHRQPQQQPHNLQPPPPQKPSDPASTDDMFELIRRGVTLRARQWNSAAASAA
uniref:WH2 domain-containing protein n=1 Tax=Macrostomum lignano TaxID=282301 RepID=A0A1I8F926_9PLAT